VNAKEKMAEEYDRKEKLLAVDLKMCVPLSMRAHTSR
jgi:hypothetical protein